MVAIKDFGIPSCCVNCDMCTSDNPLPKDENRGYCHVTQKSITNIYDERPSDCPLVEIEERKVGKWEHDKLFGECAYVCSFCHTIWTSSEIQNMHYCPTCGAEMRGNNVD